MAKVIPITERFQHFVAELQESFWGDLQGQTRAAWKKFFELDSERMRDRYAGWNRYRRGPRKAGGYRNGYYSRDFATPFGTIRLRIARARGKSDFAQNPPPTPTHGNKSVTYFVIRARLCHSDLNA